MTKLGFALIGAGNIAKIHAQAIAELEHAHITVVCNANSTRGRDLAESYGAAWVKDYHEAVQRDDVDVVSICTPSGTHGDIALAAAQAGKHLLIEKPLEITLPRIDAVLQAALNRQVKLTCIFQSRARQGVQETKKAIDAGRLGTLLFANAFVPWHRPPDYYAGNWRGTLEFDGGGALMNQSIHSVDLLQWLAGPVQRLSAQTATRIHNIEAEDTATAMLTFQNGAQGVIQGATSLGHGQPARIEIHGSAGSIILEEGRITTWKLNDAAPDEEARMLNLEQVGGSGAADPIALGHSLHRQQIGDFVTAILDDQMPPIPGAEARKSVEIIRAIYHAARTRHPVDFPFKDDGGR